VKESQYHEKFQAAVKRSGDTGISASELCDKVGSSRQAAYQWVTKHKPYLRPVGLSPLGAQRYTWRDPHSPASSDDVEIGSIFTVTRIRHVAGAVVATLASNGVELEAELN
jgi:hypothetical protein